MKKTALLAAFLGLLSAISTAHASNGAVTISSPANNSTINGLAYLSFRSRCPQYLNSVKWTVDGHSYGNATVYNSASFDSSLRLPKGWHTLKVSSTCGMDTVIFKVL